MSFSDFYTTVKLISLCVACVCQVENLLPVFPFVWGASDDRDDSFHGTDEDGLWGR